MINLREFQDAFELASKSLNISVSGVASVTDILGRVELSVSVIVPTDSRVPPPSKDRLEQASALFKQVTFPPTFKAQYKRTVLVEALFHSELISRWQVVYRPK